MRSVCIVELRVTVSGVNMLPVAPKFFCGDFVSPAKNKTCLCVRVKCQTYVYDFN